MPYCPNMPIVFSAAGHERVHAHYHPVSEARPARIAGGDHDLLSRTTQLNESVDARAVES